MPIRVDLSDPRYLNEVGWFLQHEKHGRDAFGGSYDEERLFHSRELLEYVLDLCNQDSGWLSDKTVASVGPGCTGDLSTWPAANKIAIDPLLNVYRKLDMLLADKPGTTPTVYIPGSAEDIPLVDESVDMVICRNALDHMIAPEGSISEIYRILTPGGLFYLSVDLGGEPTPDEPTVFSKESLFALLDDHFQVVKQSENHRPKSQPRESSIRILLRKGVEARTPRIDKEEVLRSYSERFERRQ